MNNDELTIMHAIHLLETSLDAMRHEHKNGHTWDQIAAVGVVATLMGTALWWAKRRAR